MVLSRKSTTIICNCYAFGHPKTNRGEGTMVWKA